MSKKIDKPLWEYTRDLHHACEEHAVGGAMASGEPPKMWYFRWILALYQIHEVIDKHAPQEFWRQEELRQDCVEMRRELFEDSNVFIPWSDVASEYVSQLDDPLKIDGAIYVLAGAGLMGGAIMQKRLQNFPRKHLEWEDRKAAIKVLQDYRLRDDIGEEARDCFQALLDIMDEIKTSYPEEV